MLKVRNGLKRTKKYDEETIMKILNGISNNGVTKQAAARNYEI